MNYIISPNKTHGMWNSPYYADFSDLYDFSSMEYLFFLYTLFPDKLYSSCGVRQQVPHSHITMDRIIISSYFNFKWVHRCIFSLLL